MGLPTLIAGAQINQSINQSTIIFMLIINIKIENYPFNISITKPLGSLATWLICVTVKSYWLMMIY